VFPQLYNEVLELLKKDIRVYLLKDTLKLKKLRMENGVEKTDENDAMLLSYIPRNYFRLLTVEEMERRIELDILINKYERLTRRIKLFEAVD
jgi:hypothetical protein